jgi:hypothetical protein
MTLTDLDIDNINDEISIHVRTSVCNDIHPKYFHDQRNPARYKLWTHLWIPLGNQLDHIAIELESESDLEYL